MELLETLIKIGSALAAVVGGAWSILQIHFKLKAKHAALEKRLNDAETEQMRRDIKKLTGIVDNVQVRLETNLKDVTAQVNNLNLGVIQTAGRFDAAIAQTRVEFTKDVGSLAERLAFLAATAGKLEEKYIGEGKYRIGPKGPKG